MEYKPVMRTLFSLSIITVVALGQVLNSDPKTKEHLTKPLLIHQRKYDNLTVTVQKLFSYLVKIQKDLDDQNSKIRFLQSMFNNVTATVLELQSYVMNLQSEQDDQERKPTSCVDVRKYDVTSGIHTLFLEEGKTLDVYCDQDTDGGGWMVIQRRQDGSVDFYRNWTEYKIGFGNLKTEFWIGLDNLHHLTKAQNVRLRVDLTDFDGSTAYAVYNTFNINGPEDNYRLNVGGYSGTAGVQRVMRTLFILSAISVTALGQMPNSCPKRIKDNLSNSLQTLQSMFEYNTASVLRLKTYILALQNYRNDQDPKIITDHLSSSPNILQSMQDNIKTSNFLLQSYFLNLQNDRDYQGAKITEIVSSSLRTLQSMYNYTTGIIGHLKSQFLFLQNYWNYQNYPVFSERKKPTSCVDVKKYDLRSGIHTLFLDDNKTLDVYCDQDTDGGGWMVIQRRMDGSVDFYRNWTEYERGFGNLNTEFWIGLANLYHLTKHKDVKLRVDLTDFHDSTAYALYYAFSISGPEDKYRLNIGGYIGTAGDGLGRHNNMQFTTYDKDNDAWKDGNCAKQFQGAWWYNNCLVSLNGRYLPKGSNDVTGVTWSTWGLDFKSLKRVEMKLN